MARLPFNRTDAKRARETAEAVKDAAGTAAEVILDPELYLASYGRYVRAAIKHGGSTGRILLVGHNPTLEYLLEILTGESAEFLTATIAHVEFDIENWKELRDRPDGRLINLWRPKELSS